MPTHLHTITAVEPVQALLRRLSANEEASARDTLTMTQCRGRSSAGEAVLPLKVRMLVRLAALVALEASTESLCWAVEHAACAGADEDEIVAVLTTIGADVGAARVVTSAPRLARAIGYEVDIEPVDVT